MSTTNISLDSTNDLFRVSVDVSQSRLIQLLDSILGRLSKLEAVSPGITTVNTLVSPSGVTPSVSEASAVLHDGATITATPIPLSPQRIHGTITVVDGKPVSLLDVVTTQTAIVKEATELKEHVNTLQEVVQTSLQEHTMPRVSALEEMVKDTRVKEVETQEKVQDLITSVSEQQDRVLVLERQCNGQEREHTTRLDAFSDQFYRYVDRQKDREEESTQRVDALQTRLEEQSKEIEQLKARVEALENRAETTEGVVESRYSSLRDTISTTTASLENLEQHVSEETAALQTHVAGVEAEVKEMGVSAAEVKGRLDALTHDHREQMARLSSAISALQMRILDLAATDPAPSVMAAANSTVNMAKSLASRGAESVILQDIRQAMTGLSQRVEGVEASVIKVSKYVKDQQASTDRILTTTQRGVREQLQNAVERLQAMQKTTRSQMSRQLIDFERDLLYVLESRRSGALTTAAGKVAVRCLTCDQPVGDVAGPYSLQHAHMHAHTHAHAHAHAHTHAYTLGQGQEGGDGGSVGARASSTSPLRTQRASTYTNTHTSNASGNGGGSGSGNAPTHDLLQLQARAHAHQLAVQCAELGMDPLLGHAQGTDVVRKLGMVERVHERGLRAVAAAVEVGGLVDGAPREPLPATSTGDVAAVTGSGNGKGDGDEGVGTGESKGKDGRRSGNSAVRNTENSEITPRTRPATSLPPLSHQHTDTTISSPRPATVPGTGTGTGIRGLATDGTGSRATGSIAPTPLPLGLASAKSLMVVAKGGEVGIHGSDGHVYRGRTNTRVLFAPPSTAVNANFTLAYTDKVPAHLLPALSQSLAGQGVMMGGIGAAQSSTMEMGPFAAVKTSMSSISGTGTLTNPYLDEQEPVPSTVRRNPTHPIKKNGRVGATGTGPISGKGSVEGDDVNVNRGYFHGNRSLHTKLRPAHVPAGWSGTQTHTLASHGNTTGEATGHGGSGTGTGMGGLRRGVSRRARVSSVANGHATPAVLEGMVVTTSATINRRAGDDTRPESGFSGTYFSEDMIPEHVEESAQNGFVGRDGAGGDMDGQGAVEEAVFGNIDDIPGGNVGECDGGGQGEEEIEETVAM